MQRAHDLLLPLVASGLPHAQYLHACGTLCLDINDENEFEKEHLRLIEAAAKMGHAKAQFHLGQAYDNGGALDHKPEVSAQWFQLSAEQGYAYAQWVHGLNLLKGTGVPADAERGLHFIRLAADGKFEGAIQFLADAYAEGRYGFPRDEALAQRWLERLRDPDIGGY